MNRMGKPDAGNLPVRFDEGGGVGVGRATPTLPANRNAEFRNISNEDTCPPTGRFSYLGRLDCQFFDEPFNRASNLALVTAYSSKRR